MELLRIYSEDSILLEEEYQHTSGTYRDTLISVCGNDSIIITNLTVNPLPDTFTITGKDTVAANQIKLYTVPNNFNLIYTWNITNGTITNYVSNDTTEIQWAALGTGYIYVVSENEYGCVSDTATLEVTIGTTGFDIINNKDIKIYPNPVKSILYISLTEKNNISAIKIYNIFGKLIDKIIPDNQNIIKYSVNHLPSGIYFIKFNTLDYIVSKKFIIIL